MIESYTPIAHMQVGATYNAVFLVKNVTVKFAKKTNDHFLNVTLTDVTGSIKGAIWNCPNKDIVQAGSYIVLEIIIIKYKDEIQFNAKGRTLQLFNGVPSNTQDYMRGPADSILEFYSQELKDHIDSIDDADYRDIILKDIDLVHILRNSPFGQEGPLTHPGGLLIHTVHTIRLAKNAVAQCKDIDGLKINSSLITLGAILRNIGWHTTTILNGSFFQPRDAFYMTGIYRASARYVDHLFLSTENTLLPEGKKQALHNLCNAIEDIKTLEGKIVAWASDLASLMHMAGSAISRKPEGNWNDGFFVGHHV
jgi:hypothetical protein